MSTDLERYQPLDMIQNIDDLARLSSSINKSGFYKDITNADQVGVKLMVARELGLGITAISFIFPVKGKITLGYQILIALVKRSGKYDLRFLERTDERCEIEWFENGKSVGRSKFDMADAKRAGLAGQDNYRKSPVEMLVARAVSSGFNSYAPECAGGGLYTLGELDDAPEPEPAPRAATPRRSRKSADTPSEEVVVDAVLVVEAPEAGTSAEAPNMPEAESASTASSPIDQCRALIADTMEYAHRKLVKESCLHLGIPWDGTTPTVLVERFGDAALDSRTLREALAAEIRAASKIPAVGEADGEVKPYTPEEIADGAAEFRRDVIGEPEGTLDDLRGAMAAAGGYGK